jgi:hypothetical protein
MSIKSYNDVIMSNEGFFGFGEYTITKVLLTGSSRNSPIYKTLRLCSDVLTNDSTLSEALNINNFIKHMISQADKEVTRDVDIPNRDGKVEKYQVTTKKSEMSIASDLTEVMEDSIRVNSNYMATANNMLKSYEAEMNNKGEHWRKVGYWEVPGLFRNTAYYQTEIKSLKLTIEKGISQVKLIEKYGVPSDTVNKVINHLENVKSIIDKAAALLDKHVLVIKGNQLSSYGL